MKDLKKQIMEKMDELGDGSTLWNAFIEITKDVKEPFITTLIADLDILEFISRGYSANSISNRLGISSKSVFDVAFTWGFEVLEETLDLDSLDIYISTITYDDFQDTFGVISPVRLPDRILRLVYENCERYVQLKEILEKYDE